MENKERIIRRKELLQRIGLSSATQWRLEKAGHFPLRRRLGRAAVGWLLTEVELWLASRERA